jgi:tetratricopeptide (TPR) repeat protein
MIEPASDALDDRLPVPRGRSPLGAAFARWLGRRSDKQPDVVVDSNTQNKALETREKDSSKPEATSESAPRPPKPEVAHLDAATKLINRRRFAEALVCIDDALAARPGMEKALYARTSALIGLSRFEEAKAVCEGILLNNPLNKVAAKQLLALGGHPPLITRRVALNVAAAAQFRPSVIMQAVQSLYDASLFEDCLEFITMAWVALNKEQSVERRTAIQAKLLHFEGLVYEASHHYYDAIQSYQREAQHPSKTFDATTSIARCYFQLGKGDKADTFIRVAHGLASTPVKLSPLSLEITLLQGRFEEAYRAYRTKSSSTALAKHFGMETMPTNLDLRSDSLKGSKAYFVNEGGPGDELRASTMYPDLLGLFPDLSLTCSPRLERIMRRTYPEITFVPVARHRAEFAQEMTDRAGISNPGLAPVLSTKASEYGQKCDLAYSIIDTLADLRPSRESFCRKGRILKADPATLQHWQGRVGSSQKYSVGLSWRSMLQSVSRNQHYLAIDELRPLAQLENVEYWLLQPRATEDEINALRTFVDLRVPNSLDLVDDFEGQLALCQSLDCVIAPFTTNAELAGAAGVPAVFISASHSTSWRRNEDGSDIWHHSANTIAADPIWDRQKTMALVVEAVQQILTQCGERL